MTAEQELAKRVTTFPSEGIMTDEAIKRNVVAAMKNYAKQLLSEYTDKIVENVTASHVECWGQRTGEIEINKESITNQLDLFLKERL